MRENEQPALPPEEVNKKDLDIMEFLSAVDLVTEEQVARFRDTKVIPQLRPHFDERYGNSRYLFVAIDSLTDEQFSALKDIANDQERDWNLPGVHKIRALFIKLHMITEDPKYQLDAPA